MRSTALLIPAPPSHHVLRPHIWCTICITPPNVTGSPSPSLEGAEGERGTRKVILGVNVLWTSLDASGQSRHAAEQGRVIISWKLTTGYQMKTKQLHHTVTLWQHQECASCLRSHQNKRFCTSVINSITKKVKSYKWDKSKYIKDSSNLL